LAGENAELGQFSDDGVVIRRNMERLEGEVGKLRLRWDDATKDYDELLAENERLRALLADAEGRALNDKNPAFEKKFKIKVDPGDKANQGD